MIESGAIVELSNHKKYMITESSIEDGKIFYLALEVDDVTEEPKEISIFFEHVDDTLIPISDENDIRFLQTVFYDKFAQEVMSE